MFTSSTFALRQAVGTFRTLAAALTLLVGLSFSAKAQNSGLFDDYVSINNVFYKTNATNAPANAYVALQGASLGTFDRSTGTLRLNGGLMNSYERNGDNVSVAYLYYRVYAGTTAPAGRAFQRINLPLTNTASDPGNGTINKEFSSFINTTNLLSLVNAPGTYTLEIYLQADATYNNAGGNGTFVLNDTNNGANYKASFTVTGTPQGVTTWTGAVSDNWFDPANWTDGVPTPTNNAVIPDFGPGNVTYPNIYSNAQALNTNGTVRYDNTNSGPAECFTLLMQGSTAAAHSVCRLTVGTLRIYGDFYNQYDNFIPAENTTIEFAGATQTISGGARFMRVGIAGSGIKNLTGNMSVSKEIYFSGGILATDINNPTTSYVELAGRSSINNNEGAQLTGEVDGSYLRGIVRTLRTAMAINQTGFEPFGNIGMWLQFTGTNTPGDVLVTRNATESYNPMNDRYSIRRIFDVRPTNTATSTGGLQANLKFGYLDSDLTNLNLNGDAIDETNLYLYVSTNTGSSWGQLGRDALDQSANVLTKYGVTTLSTFTLGDRTAPLPVTLTAFNAKRSGNETIVTWDTAMEKDSKGFDVQVSTDGREFQSLGFVASAAANTSQFHTYRFVDTTPNKAGTRYYRLRQVDLSGQATYFAVKAVTFEGRAASTTSLAAYPNPFVGELRLTLQTSDNGTGQLQLTDLTGRVLSKQPVTLVAGTNDISLSNVSDLQAGIYLARYTSPSGEVSSLKVRKL